MQTPIYGIYYSLAAAAPNSLAILKACGHQERSPNSRKKTNGQKDRSKYIQNITS